MKHKTIHTGVHALLVAILFTGLLATAASAGDDAQTICEGNGGNWTASPDAANGVCTYSPDDPAYDCIEPFIMHEVWVSDSFSYDDCVDFRPFDVNEDDTCAWIGGTWDQSGDPWTCTVTHTAFGDCPGTTIYQYQISTSDYIGFECAGEGDGDAGNGGGGVGGQPTTALRNPGYSKHGGKIKNDSVGSAHLGGNKNGSFYYNEGTCAEGCIFTPNLPAGAAASLPSDAVATLYIRLADGGTGSYTVCFDATGMSSPVIYQLISGVWTAIPTLSSGGQICATASGDGAFALGGS